MVEVTIDSMAFGGSGVGRVDGKVVFVPYSYPGDRLQIELTREEKGFSEGGIVSILEPSPMRQTPQCRHHSICGGCHWLHIPYKEQTSIKEGIYRDILRRMGGLPTELAGRIVPSPQEFNYRNRVQFKVWGRKIGFYRRESHELVDIDSCPLAHPLINSILSVIRGAWSDSIGEVARVDVNISPSDEKGIATIYLKERSGFDFKGFLSALCAARPELAGLIVRRGKEKRVFGSDLLYSTEGEYRLQASEGSFSQVNYHQNLNMKRQILDLAGLIGKEAVLELYAGGGNFTIPLAGKAGRVTAVEINPSSIADMKGNAKQNGRTNLKVIEGTSEKGLERLDAGEKFDVVVTDPPRDGCSQKVIEGMVRLNPKKIIYVSCNPTTLARDLKKLGALGYETVSSVPFDMFPQTYHIESITELRRRAR